MKGEGLGLAGRLAAKFINNKITPLIVVAAVIAGLMATLALPREEEPQIVVPMVDIMVSYPGASAKEVESRVVKPVEKLLWEVKGVEYIYSTSMPGQAMFVMRFLVNEDEEKSLIKLYHKLSSHPEALPPGASQPLIKLRSIYDVPILALTLWSDKYSPMELKRVANQVLSDQIKQVKDVSEVTVIGGQQRQVRVDLDPVKLAGHSLSPGAIFQQLQGANQQLDAGTVANNNTAAFVKTGNFLSSADDVKNLVVGAFGGHPIYLRDVAGVKDGAEDPEQYVSLGVGPHGKMSGIDTEKYRPGTEYNAVTISIAKHKGANAINVAHQILQKVEDLQRSQLPSDVHITVTRNYGDSATEKSNELLLHMLLAIISVVILIAIALGWRESIIVGLAVPVTLALTMLVFYLYRYTLNRVTLFALVFSIGILVDDAIVIVENIVRHYRLPQNRGRSAIQVTIEAVDEVGNPTILATFAVIASIMPMAFVRGLMGPYMSPIPVGATAAMLFSMFIAFIVSPWAAYRLLHKDLEKQHDDSHSGEQGLLRRAYERFSRPLLTHPKKRLLFLGALVGALLLVLLLFPTKGVIMKMLPFDNKGEFQVMVNAPESYSLEQTRAATEAMAGYLATIPEVTDYQVYAGTSAPFNFNGLVRHYYLRRGNNVADIQVNLGEKGTRKRQSHEIAKAVRPKLKEIADRYGVVVQVAEVPPGPPVLSTIVAEVYGQDYEKQIAIARQIQQTFNKTPGVVDVDNYIEDEMPEYRFTVDKEKATLSGIDTAQVTQTIAMAVHGYPAGLTHIPAEQDPVSINLRIPLAQRSNLEDLQSIQLQAADGHLVPLSEVTNVEQVKRERNIYHKNLQPVVYVTSDVAGREESPVYEILKMRKALDGIELPGGYKLRQYWIDQPFSTEKFSMKWDGEWQITYEVFRDLGVAFAVVLLLIYALVTGWFQSFKTPIAIMAVIPLSLIGIVVAHWAFGAFFTATSMIGFIAGAGIVVRNSIILIDYAEIRLREGMSLVDACIDAGATRFRPILLTALAVAVAAVVILFDPIFQGMALALMFGEIAAVIFTPLAVPVIYYVLKRKESEGARASQPAPVE
ncbi:MAG: efflux RND transporter permease subunit [Armatimonadota bacterium]